MSRLLVSVRSADEALIALSGGADLIDVKEPERGSLGAANDATVAAVLARVDGQRPVSAALGELTEWKGAPHLPAAGLCFAKWGLADCASRDWPELFRRAAARLPAGCQPVVVAYADACRAAAPPVDVVAEFAQALNSPLLIDTHRKDGMTLLDWLNREQLQALVRRCRAAGVPLALAGSLTAEQLCELVPLAPDWFAVRGAACTDGRRGSVVSRERVERLAGLLRTNVAG